MPRPTLRNLQPDIEFASSVQAASLHFGRVPEAQVRFNGMPGRDATTDSRRTNVTDPAVAGVSYQDAQVEYAFKSSVTTRANVRIPPSEGDRHS